MREITVLIGGKAGDGINQAGTLLGRLFSELGYFVYMYFDYPSLIQGGHNFAVIRASEKKVASIRKDIDYILAINQDTVDFHVHKLKIKNKIIFDNGVVKAEGLGLPLAGFIKEENAQPIMRNAVLIGAFAGTIGASWEILEKVFRRDTSKEIDVNLRLAAKGYKSAAESEKIEVLGNKNFPVLTGNEALGLGLMNAGLDAYIAYPMTPTSNLLHFLAKTADGETLKVIHPESEIGVILMALGFSYAGKRSAVGTSGGGFCLMTEGLSFSGMAELPVVIVVGSRPGPSTGLPTYTSQGDLRFVLTAGQGEFTRFVTVPGDLEEAYYWSGVALNVSWKYRIPSIVLTDKTLNEDAFSYDGSGAGDIKKEETPALFPPDKNKVIKANSYEHDENGITTEDPKITGEMCEKRMKKEKLLAEELEKYETVKIYGNKNSETAVLSWGSNKGPCKEVAENLGLKLIQVLVFSPFPVTKLKETLKGVTKLIVVENNVTGEAAEMISAYGVKVDEKILKYDGRPFIVDELEEKIKEASGWK